MSKLGNEIYTERYERINLSDLLAGRFTRDDLSWYAS